MKHMLVGEVWGASSYRAPRGQPVPQKGGRSGTEPLERDWTAFFWGERTVSDLVDGRESTDEGNTWEVHPYCR